LIIHKQNNNNNYLLVRLKQINIEQTEPNFYTYHYHQEEEVCVLPTPRR